ncbi:hypothetical protein [Candidatus Enterococcus murrayae]|uniref:Uncharacterized protein n=1 Tax=Candidatus Enterococcus murrayae TaxID=2815321 RepID=A0ABS3HBY5_9ENTE|nr:hypothetical protein [Enterococcus sp. MJM16]MBO0450961.1 hypothetical protein [Enterococcus sp. MJM16]
MGKDLASFFESNEEEIVTEFFSIKDNVLHFDSVSIQLSNISRIFTGKRKLKLPIPIIIVFVVSLLVLSLQPVIGLIGMGLSGFYLYMIYQQYNNNKQFLIINLNSGYNYLINFKDGDFMEQVRTVLEKAFSKNTSATVNIAQQRIIQGDNHSHVVVGDFANVNSGVQKDSDIHSHNSNSYNANDNSTSTTIGDIKDSTISSSTFGNQNQQVTKSNEAFDWALTRKELQSVISQIKIDSPVKEASEKALIAAEKEDEKEFNAVLKENKSIFMSELFMNTASGVLAQIISTVLGIV